MKYKFLPHTADIKFQAFGNSIEKAFENAALAITNIITKDKIKSDIKKAIKVKGKDKEALLYNFLEEFLFLFETKGFLLSKISKLTINKTNESYELTSKLLGDINKNEKHEISNHIKAITYNQMFVKQEKDKFICQVVVDV